MRFSARSAAWLLPLALCACAHKPNLTQVQPLAPPIEDAPPPKPVSLAANLQPPVITEPKQTVSLSPQPKPETPKTPPRHPKKTAKTSAGTAPNAVAAPPQVAANEPEVPAIGHLSSGEADGEKKQVSDSINEVDRGLGGITRKLNDSEEKISIQIREYLKQARAALSSSDVDGARTLAVKAKVLLTELTQ